jgi:16S rRNA (cytosine967-C5)-methyltransferase
MHPHALLDACARLLEAVFRFDQPADAVVARFCREHRSLGPRERTLLADTVFTVLRERLRLEWLARDGSGPVWRRLAILGFAGDRAWLAVALSEAEKAWLAACDAVDEAQLPAQCRHNLPGWLTDALRAQVGDDAFDALAASLLQPAPLDVRVNVLKRKREVVLADLAAAGLQAAPTPYSPWGVRLQGKPSLGRLPAYVNGEIEVQDEGSQLLALVVDARRGEMVADFCAGAGGKTLALGAAMRNQGRLYAFDTVAARLERLKPRLARSGLDIVYPVAIAHERDERLHRLAGKLDRVLVDAPCSGLGTLRRHPDLKWRQAAEQVAAHARQQARILAAAARLVKPGGRLVYATCSLLAEENEAVAEAFTAAQRDFEVLPMPALLAAAHVPAADTLCDGEQGRYLRLWPHRHATDGFFAAAWRRRR